MIQQVKNIKRDSHTSKTPELAKVEASVSPSANCKWDGANKGCLCLYNVGCRLWLTDGTLGRTQVRVGGGDRPKQPSLVPPSNPTGRPRALAITLTF